MCEQYEANPWGWDAAGKRSELAHDDARFVLVRGGGGAIQAFAHFRFDVNDEDYASRAVLYVRELQVAEPFRGAGLGRRVMGLLQRVARGAAGRPLGTQQRGPAQLALVVQPQHARALGRTCTPLVQHALVAYTPWCSRMHLLKRP